MENETILTAARYLRPGDYLIGSRRLVLEVRPMGRHVQVATSRDDGNTVRWNSPWRSDTTMRIRRPVRPTVPIGDTDAED